MTQLSLTIPDTVDEQVAAIDAQIAELQVQRDVVQRGRLVACVKCKVQTPISALAYVQLHSYVQPYGCTGGDYWYEGDGLFDCPSCTATNRIPKENEKNPLILARSTHVGLAKLKRYFGKIVDRYDP